MTRPGPAHNPDRAEEPWFDASIDELGVLRARLEDELGASPQVADGVVGAIIGQSFEARSTATRAEYRRLLREIGPPPSARPRRIRRAGQRGAAALELVSAGAVSGAGAAMAFSGALGAPGAIAGALVAIVPPIILDESSEPSEPLL